MPSSCAARTRVMRPARTSSSAQRSFSRSSRAETGSCVACVASTAALRAGTGAAGEVPAAAKWGPQRISVEWWQRELDYALTNNAGAGTAYDDSSTGGWFCATTTEGGTVRLAFSARYGASPASTMSASTGIRDGSWHHYACTYDGSVMRLFVDGTVVGEKPYAGGLEYTNQALTILHRNRWSSGGTKNYDVRELRLSSQSLYSAAFTPAWRSVADSSTVALWRFEEASGTSVTDAVSGTITSIQGTSSRISSGTYCGSP